MGLRYDDCVTRTPVQAASPEASPDAILRAGRHVLDAEAAAITQITLGDAFVEAVSLVADLRGRLIVCGIGKSGLIGAKLAATFSSTGTPASFLHATEAMHGDLGCFAPGDAALLLSYSGRTAEVLRVAEAVAAMPLPIITLTGGGANPLVKAATVSLEIGEVQEAGPLESAPTASAAATLALGDALALSVSHRRGFDQAAFHRLHPEGRLGRELMPVTQAMRFRAHHNLPLVPVTHTLGQAYNLARDIEQASGVRRAGALVVVDGDGRLAGIFTDADLRRLVFTHRGDDPAALPMHRVMTANPTVLHEWDRVRDALKITRDRRIDEIPVVDSDARPLGLLDVQDLVALQLIDEG